MGNFGGTTSLHFPERSLASVRRLVAKNKVKRKNDHNPVLFGCHDASKLSQPRCQLWYVTSKFILEGRHKIFDHEIVVSSGMCQSY